MVSSLYTLLENLVLARYQKDKLPQLQLLNSQLFDIGATTPSKATEEHYSGSRMHTRRGGCAYRDRASLCPLLHEAFSQCAVPQQSDKRYSPMQDGNWTNSSS